MTTSTARDIEECCAWWRTLLFELRANERGFRLIRLVCVEEVVQLGVAPAVRRSRDRPSHAHCAPVSRHYALVGALPIAASEIAAATRLMVNSSRLRLDGR